MNEAGVLFVKRGDKWQYLQPFDGPKPKGKLEWTDFATNIPSNDILSMSAGGYKQVWITTGQFDVFQMEDYTSDRTFKQIPGAMLQVRSAQDGVTWGLSFDGFTNSPGMNSEWERASGRKSVSSVYEPRPAKSHSQTNGKLVQPFRYKLGEISIQEVIDNVKEGWSLIPDHRMIQVSAGHNGAVVGLEYTGIDRQ